jgi:hypothetical protein
MKEKEGYTGQLADRIHRLSILPARFNIMLEQALLTVSNTQEREDLCTVACIISSSTWQHWQAWRSLEDNRQEHEWVVFANVMKIAESEELPLSDKRIATAFCFLHDTAFIKRIMEEEIRKLDEKGLREEADKMRRMKKNQRADHMEGGAENAKFLLKQLKVPDSSTMALLTEDEVQRCIGLIAKHDLWKVDPPVPPPTSDRLALACLEGDVLWPLHPIGVLADLDRPNTDGKSRDLFEPLKWREQLQQSLKTLVEFRPKWKDIPNSDFIDRESIFRTKEGHRLFTEWKRLWNL